MICFWVIFWLYFSSLPDSYFLTPHQNANCSSLMITIKILFVLVQIVTIVMIMMDPCMRRAHRLPPSPPLAEKHKSIQILSNPPSPSSSVPATLAENFYKKKLNRLHPIEVEMKISTDVYVVCDVMCTPALHQLVHQDTSSVWGWKMKNII